MTGLKNGCAALLTLDKTLHTLSKNNLLTSCPKIVRILIRAGTYLRVDGISCLALWGATQAAQGSEIIFEGDKSILDYLSRMNLFKTVGFDYKEDFTRHDEDGRFIPILRVNDPEACGKVVDEICILVVKQIINSATFLPAMECCVNELTDNMLRHAQAPIPGVVCAQYFPTRKKLHIAIADNGIGIRSSLSQSQSLSSDQEALERALEKGVTRDKEDGMGNGLAGALEILKLNKGIFTFSSGTSQLKLSLKETVSKQLPNTSGTLIMMDFDTKNPVNIEKTILGNSGHSFLDRSNIQDLI